MCTSLAYEVNMMELLALSVFEYEYVFFSLL